MLKKRLIETVLLRTHNIGFGGEIRKLVSCYALFTKGLIIICDSMDMLIEGVLKGIKYTKLIP